MIAATRLSAAQQRVVEHPLDRPGLVAAGAGTGKTFTIVERVAFLNERGLCPAKHVLLLTFGRKAAAELRARIGRRLGEEAPACYTFHAFAWHILASHAYDVGLSPETTVIEDADARVEFRKAFDDFLSDPTAAASGFPLRTFNCDEIRTALFGLDQRIKQEGLTFEAFRTRALAAADDFARIQYRQLREPYLKPYKGQDFRVRQEVTDEDLAREIVWEKQRVEACAQILRRFARRLAERAALTYSDILLLAERAIRRNPFLRDQLAHQYRCCIVDEYQDTDLAQHRLLEALFGAGLPRVVVVGDPLQSIFSFRGAHPDNVGAFERAPDSVTYSLVENRRSRQEILDFSHAAIVRGHGDAAHLRGERGHAGEQIVHVSSLWRTPQGDHPDADESREREAEAAALRIGAMLGSKIRVPVSDGEEPVAPKHFAILSRTKRNVQPVTQALLRAGIPFKLVGGVGFYDAPEIRDALAWLRLLADPLDSFAVARALQSSTIGAPDAIVARLGWQTQRDETAFARRVLVDDLPSGDDVADRSRSAAQTLRRLLDGLAPMAALPLLGALRAVFDATGIERSYEDSADPRAAQALANLTKLEALARSFAQSTPGAQPADFVSFIDELEGVDFDEREADVSDRDAVTIATIHAAKGLEWPYVFLIGVWPQLPSGPRLILDDASGALLYSENPDGSRSFHYEAVKRRADAEGNVMRDDEREENLEERRLFYVGATRARDRLFVSGIRRKPSAQHPAGKPDKFILEAYEVLDERGWKADEPVAIPEPRLAPAPPQEPPVFSAGAARTHEAASTVATGMQLPLISVNGEGSTHAAVDPAGLRVPLSYSFIARFEQCPRRATYRRMFRLPEVAECAGTRTPREHDAGVERALEAAPPDSLVSAGDYGVFLHLALEHWARDKKDNGAGCNPSEYLVAAAHQLSLSPSSKQRQAAASVLEQIMRRLEAWQPLAIEAPFTLDFGNEGRPLLVTGFLDLLARDANGKPCLIDYKTGNPSTDHALQLGLYRHAAASVYGVGEAQCFIGQIDDTAFHLKPVEPVSNEELQRRISAVSEGLLACDVRATPGTWCRSCGYRAAPCQDFLKS